MSKIVNLFNGGKKSRRTGVVNVNSYNVHPTTLVATAAGAATLTLDLLDGSEFFTGNNTSAATDRILIPASADIGTQIIIKAGTSFGVIRSGSDTINGVTTIITIAANGTAELLKTAATTWILTHRASNGSLTAPVI